MISSSKTRWAARAGAVTLAFVLGASASAGTLYSWKTEDGTYAYTNEKKRIPARYKNEAETSNLGTMQKYARFTPGPKVEDKAYSERLIERLEVLRGSEADAAVVGTAGAEAPQAGPYVRLGINRERTDIEIPVNDGAIDDEPVVVEHIRMRKTNGRQSTRHFKVVKQGERILAVIKDRIHEQPPRPEHEESDYDSDPLE